MEVQPWKKQFSGVHAAYVRCQCFKTGGKHWSKEEEPGQGQSSCGICTYLVCQHHQLIHLQASLEGEAWLSHFHENTELST